MTAFRTGNRKRTTENRQRPESALGPRRIRTSDQGIMSPSLGVCAAFQPRSKMRFLQLLRETGTGGPEGSRDKQAKKSQNKSCNALNVLQKRQFFVRSWSRDIRCTGYGNEVSQSFGVVSALSFSCLTPPPTLRGSTFLPLINLCLTLARGPTTGRTCFFSLSRSVAARCWLFQRAAQMS